MCFDAEPPEAFWQCVRRARKEHRCCECRITIEPGTRYEYVSGIWDGYANSYKTCLGCVSLRDAVVEHERAAGCFGNEAYPPLGDLYTSAHDIGIVCYVPWRDQYIEEAS